MNGVTIFLLPRWIRTTHDVFGSIRPVGRHDGESTVISECKTNRRPKHDPGVRQWLSWVRFHWGLRDKVVLRFLSVIRQYRQRIHWFQGGGFNIASLKVFEASYEWRYSTKAVSNRKTGRYSTPKGLWLPYFVLFVLPLLVIAQQHRFKSDSRCVFPISNR
jgi:hypothetical protein